MNSPPFLKAKVEDQGARDASGQTCLLVLGMHRSGTSALTRVLSIAGAKLPSSLMGAGKGNDAGHWESNRFLQYHEQLLEEFGSTWHDWCALEVRHLPLKRRQEIKIEIADLLAAEFGDARLFVVKDPRICRFTPIFLDALEDAGVSSRIVHIVRNPLEVAESLERRDGLLRTDAALQWLRHVLESEAATRSRRRVIISYDGLLSDWRATFNTITEALRVAWPYSAEEIAGQVAQFLDQAHRHHTHSTEDVLLDASIRDWVGETYSAMLMLEQRPESKAAMTTLDAVRREFNHAAPILRRLQADARSALENDLAKFNAEIGQARTESERLKATLAERGREGSSLKASLDEAETRGAQLTAALAERDKQVADLNAAIEQTRTKAEQLGSALTERDEQVADLSAAVEEVRTKAEQLGSALTERDKQVAGLNSTVEQSDAKAAELASALAERDKQITDFCSTVDEKNAEAEQLASVLREQDAQITGVRAMVDQANAKVVQLAETLKRRDEETTDLKSQLAAKRRKLTQLIGQVDKRRDQIAKLEHDNRELLNEANLSREELIAHFRSSTSWKLTGPVRALKHFFNEKYLQWHPYHRMPHPSSGKQNKIAPNLEVDAVPPANIEAENQQAHNDTLADLASQSEFVGLYDGPPLESPPVRVISFYLPQFHAIPENDEWWGKGFTEWTNVRPAMPQFHGHYQPHLPEPTRLGYYDLTDVNVQHQQVALAKLYGLGGFCFYFYWFGGKRLLELPLRNYLNNPNLDLPFCLCWANENWSRRWDGLDNELLIAQSHSENDDLAFIQHVSQYLKDDRYIRIRGRPLLIVYRPNLLPNPKQTARRWREWCRRSGLGEIHLAYTQSFGNLEPAAIGFDSAIEFPPNNANIPPITNQIDGLPRDFPGTIYDWQMLAQKAHSYGNPHYSIFRSVCPGWDNTPRRGKNGTIFVNNTPQAFQEWVSSAIEDTRARFVDKDEQLIFVNAWNEWAEGAHLEPDAKYGYAWLDAIRLALSKSKAADAVGNGRIVVVSHDAHPHGAQMLAINIARTLRDRFAYDVDIVLLGEGPLTGEFENIGSVHCLSGQDPSGSQAAAVARMLKASGACAAICNTAVSGAFLETLKCAGFETLSLIHELPSVLEKYELHGHAASIARYADHIVFPAELVASSFRKFAPVDPEKVLIRPQGIYKKNIHRSRVDLMSASWKLRASLNLPSASKIVLGVGYADERKGFDLFVDAAEAKSGDQHETVFVWVGHHEEHLARRLCDRTRRLCEQGKLILPGRLENTDLYYAGADAYLLTSREDPYPSTILEAFDVGLPIIGFQGTTGAEDLIRAHDGVLETPFDIKATVGSLERALATETLDSRWSRARCFRQRPDVPFQSYVHDLLQALRQPPRPVSAIVPNYNYAHFLPQRIESILNQTYPIRELIFLDDASTDNSLQVIEEILEGCDIPIRIIANTTNSGCVSRQWLRGVEAASCDYVWIAEADDLSEPEFLAAAMAGFEDDDVVLSYTQSKQMAQDESILCDSYLEYTKDISPTQWLQNYKRAGKDEICNGLSVKNTIPNVSAVVFKRDALLKTMTEHINHITQYRVAGDWCVYVNLLRHGSLCFSARALNLHRRHDESVTINRFGREELGEIDQMQTYVAEAFDVDPFYLKAGKAYLDELINRFGLH